MQLIDTPKMQKIHFEIKRNKKENKIASSDTVNMITAILGCFKSSAAVFITFIRYFRENPNVKPFINNKAESAILQK